MSDEPTAVPRCFDCGDAIVNGEKCSCGIVYRWPAKVTETTDVLDIDGCTTCPFGHFTKASANCNHVLVTSSPLEGGKTIPVAAFGTNGSPVWCPLRERHLLIRLNP